MGEGLGDEGRLDIELAAWVVTKEDTCSFKRFWLTDYIPYSINRLCRCRGEVSGTSALDSTEGHCPDAKCKAYATQTPRLSWFVDEKSIERYSFHSHKNPRVLRILADNRHLSTKTHESQRPHSITVTYLICDPKCKNWVILIPKRMSRTKI